MSVRYNDNWQYQKGKAVRYAARDLKNLRILLENLAEGLGSRRERWWRYVVSFFENTPKNLVFQGMMQLEHSSHIVMVGIEATWLRFNPWRILKETTEPAGPFGTMSEEHWHPGIGTRCALFNSTAGKCAPMQVVKQLEHGRTSTTEEQKWSYFQTNYDK